MTAPAFAPPLAGLPPISLDELVAEAGLLTRTDRKYMLPVADLAGFLASFMAGSGRHARILEIDGLRSFTYESVYFDTPELTSYRLTAHRRRRRFKVRVRTYLDSGQCWLEVKVAGARGRTEKHRVPHHPFYRDTIAPGRQFVEELLSGEGFLGGGYVPFHATLTSAYQRCTLFLPATASRVTIDTDLIWRSGPDQLPVPGMAVIETKTSSGASDVDRMLWRRGHRPARISKYATGLAALRPDLPANRWRRTLRRLSAAHPAAPTPPTAPAGPPPADATTGRFTCDREPQSVPSVR